MSLFLQLAFQGVALGLVYGLIALGFVIVFKGSHTFNFAHGELVGLSAYVVVTLIPHVPYWAGFAVAVAVMAVFAVLIEIGLMRRLAGKGWMTIVLATFGVSIMIHQLILMIWGPGKREPAGPVGSGTVEVGSVVLPYASIATIAAAIVVLTAVTLFFQRTSYGLALRATASNEEAALAQGIDVHRMFAISWAVAAGLAVVAGVFLASFPRITSPTLGTVALIAIPAIVIGGMDSLVGSIVGGLAVGLIQVLGARYLADVGDGQLHQVLPYVLMFVILLVRPYGLFGSRSVERV